jgi:LacI family transcriptional regulator
MVLSTPRSAERVTIRDIAKEAGVSITAVSRALNRKAELSPEKRERVLAAVERLHYKPSAVARALVSGSTRTLGVVVTDNTSPIYADILRGIEEAANAAGFAMLFANSADSQEQALRCLDLLLAKQVDGLLWTPVQSDRRDLDQLRQAAVPFVLLLRHFADVDTDFVALDNVKSGFLVTTHLLEQGWQRIAHVAGPLHISSAQDRLDGYRRALKKAKVPVDDALVSSVPYTIEGGYQAASRLLDQAEPPEAIFAATDLQAVGVLKAARERGLRVPEDLGLAGGDDIELGEFLEAPLTTFHLPAREIGARAAEILISRIRRKRLARQQVIFEPTLITRRSSVCPRQRS